MHADLAQRFGLGGGLDTLGDDPAAITMGPNGRLSNIDPSAPLITVSGEALIDI